jgi:phospholipid/cholesterol/gamma-HCH transport system substrate-binding protein
MPRTRSLAFKELKLGLIGVVAVALAAALIIAVGGQAGFFWQNYPLKTKFSNVQGMKPGAVVRVSGMDVGRVEKTEFAGSEVIVELSILKKVRPLITTGSRASIGALSLLGEPIIEITAAPADGTPLPDNAFLPATGSGGMIADMTERAKTTLDQANDIIASIRAGKGTLGKLFADEAAYNDLDRLLLTSTRVAASLESTKGTAGRLINDPAVYDSLKKSLDDLNTVLQPLKHGTSPLGRLLNDDALGKSLSTAVTNLEATSARLGKTDGTLGALINERQLYDRLNGVTDRIDKLVTTLQGTTGTAGQLLNDRALYDNMNSTLKEMQLLLADIRKDPKKFLRVSVSIF